jgi:hypothetical protein
MPILTSESPVALDQLDNHLKAILKVKLREFVHLSPFFADIPSIDVSRYCPSPDFRHIPAYIPAEPLEACPNHNRSLHRRRVARSHAV